MEPRGLERRWGARAAILLVAALSVAATGRVGDALYVRARNTRVLQRPSFDAKVLKVVQPGQTVVWQGAVPGEPRWHRVSVAGVEGVVFRSNLSTTPPSHELVRADGGTEVDPSAFVASGAAVKALGEGAISYGRATSAEAAADLLVLEALSREVKSRDVSEHARKTGLFPVVGSRE